MEQTMNPAVPMDPPQPTVDSQMKHDHWFVQVVGGLALTNAIVSSLAIFWVFMEFGLPTS